MAGVTLSIFPGADLFGHAFELEGFCVVRGPDVLWGGDIRTFHPPAGVFDGIIATDPCQSHSSLANLVRAKGLEPKFGDFTPEVNRVIEEARPRWFVRENVPRAPDVKPAGYDVRTFLLDNWSSLGEEQQRRRRFWFGVRDGRAPELRKFIDFALFIPADCVQAITHSPDPVPVKLGGSGKLKRTAVTAGHDGTPEKDYSTRYTLEEMLALQGLPADFFQHSPFTVQGKRKLVGNAVPMPLGRALAKAVRRALESMEPRAGLTGGGA